MKEHLTNTNIDRRIKMKKGDFEYELYYSSETLIRIGRKCVYVQGGP